MKAYSEIRTEKLKVIDIGTGAGFPGIPLKIVFPQIELTLLDSLQKRLKFLQEVIDQLGLGEVELIHGRAEDFCKTSMKKENIMIFAFPERLQIFKATLSELCLPVCEGGRKVHSL